MKQLSKVQKKAFLISLALFGILSLITFLLTPILRDRFYPLLPDKGAAWYFWQLPSVEQGGRISFWLGYGLHQIIVWILILKGINRKPLKEGIANYNYVIFGVNFLFAVLHLLQTHIWYDGLAQDVPIWTSQGSVIVMLVLILFLMIPVRGLFWGKRFTPPATAYRFVRRWHGIYISWALVYTFWFHPMDGNWGLISGFVYMFLLFIQLSYFNTPIHFMRWWIVLLESFVTVHAFLITIYKDNPIWTMFLTGFLVMFFLTQVHTFRLKTSIKWLLLFLFAAGTLLLYIFVRGISHIYEVTFIPLALYGGAGALLLIGFVIEKIKSHGHTAGS